MNQKVDYLIVGLGLAGSTLAWELIQRGKKIMVFDAQGKNLASSVAAGLFNPVTGKYLTRTWQADKIFPFFEQYYCQAEKKLKQNFLHNLPLFSPFSSAEEKNLWRLKGESEDLKEFIRAYHEHPVFEHQVHNPLGGVEIAHSGYVRVESWMAAVRKFLIALQVYREEWFDEREISFYDVMKYRDLDAGKIIFCNGLAVLENRWFGNLPVIPLKGEVLTVRIPAKLERIYNRGVYVVPGEEEGLYKVGATYERPPFHQGISETAREHLQTRLHELLRYQFEVIHQEWGMRPTTIDRRPILGHHPDNKNLIIFNGLGTKGVSLAPYFAHHLATWLEGEGELSAEVNIYRFKALYSR